MRMPKQGTSTLLAAFVIGLGGVWLAACGGGGSTGTTAAVDPPSGLSYPQPQPFSIGQAIQPLSPTVTGTVSQYAVAPQLPAGMSLNSTTGVISGTPTASAASAAYTLTATNSGGSTTAVVQIAVNDRAPVVYYPQNHIALTLSTQSPTNTPLSLGGAVSAWSISPALPAGLTLSATDGSISGTPSAESPSINYTVTATNSGGTTTASVRIAVAGLNLLDLGHVSQVNLVEFDATGQRALSMDFAGHWALWDYFAGTLLADNDSQCTPDTCRSYHDDCHFATCPNNLQGDLKGSTIAIQIPLGFEVLSATDGHAIAGIPATPSWWRLASDGSYISAGSAAGLYAWAPAGQLLVFKPGNYAAAQAFAAADEIRVAGGGAGQDVIETVTVATGNSSVSPAFQGTFQSWFVDGERFLTATSNTILAYSKTAIQQGVISVTQAQGLGGSGGYFWNVTGQTLDIYTVGAGSSPALSIPGGTYPPAVLPSGSFIGVVSRDSDQVPTAPEISIVDLSGSAPVRTDQPVPFTSLSALAVKSASNWLAGSAGGVLADTTARQLNLGAALDIAGSASRFAVATVTGNIFYFDATSGARQGTIAKFSGKLQLSSDGGVLAALGDTGFGQFVPDRTVGVYALPSKAVIGTFPQTDPNQSAFDIALSADGTTLGQVLSPIGNIIPVGTPSKRQVTLAGGGAVIWSDSVNDSQPVFEPIRLSPDGTRIAAPLVGATTPTGGSNLIQNGVLVTAVTGLAVGWLDNNRFLANTYHVVNGNGLVQYDTTAVYDAGGHKLGTAPLAAAVMSFTPVGSDSIFVPAGVSVVSPPAGILSLTTGTVLFSTGEPSTLLQRPSPAAVAGSRVVYVAGTRLIAVAY